ncbi:hypothetical protein Y1Q_0016162 [Alligator mississippiensis]|uniref:Uncharacterized protein n=1 Tax=Alligator mississippiensis TaxID=8496 RepID=A0A151P0Y2_ALLMI|nr:hypothetical protein Y1Q_0016162 [Alligator mississippiensis]
MPVPLVAPYLRLRLIVCLFRDLPLSLSSILSGIERILRDQMGEPLDQWAATNIGRKSLNGILRGGICKPSLPLTLQ